MFFSGYVSGCGLVYGRASYSRTFCGRTDDGKGCRCLVFS